MEQTVSFVLDSLRLRSWYGNALCLGVALIVSGCASPWGCVPGSEAACACLGGLTGVQTCNAAGTYEPCVCPASSPVPTAPAAPVPVAPVPAVPVPVAPAPTPFPSTPEPISLETPVLPLVPLDQPVLTSEQIAEVVSRGRLELQRCWESAIRGMRETPSVRLDVEITVDASGAVTRTVVHGPAVGGLNSCIERGVGSWRFPSGGGTTRAVVPVVFSGSS